MTETAMTDLLHTLLVRVASTAGPDFSGIGLVVTDRPETLPTFPLRPDIAVDGEADVAELLASISVAGGALHDGFHILSSGLRVTSLSQYFSPPVVPNLTIDRSHAFGGRFLAAFFGSALPGVIATGIATTTVGVVTFANGLETSRETPE